jgi:hypothetical protein
VTVARQPRGKHNFTTVQRGVKHTVNRPELLHNTNVPPCIYCGNQADSPEHWLARSLGTFGPLQVLQDKVCGDCNQAFGREIDLEFTRVGPEAILRAGLGIEGRHGAAQSPFYFRAASNQPLRAVVPDAPDDEAGLLWETVPGASGEPEGRLLQQLVIVDQSDQRHAIPFNIEWSTDVLRKAVKNRGINGGTLVEIYLDPVFGRAFGRRTHRRDDPARSAPRVKPAVNS